MERNHFERGRLITFVWLVAPGDMSPPAFKLLLGMAELEHGVADSLAFSRSGVSDQ